MKSPLKKPNSIGNPSAMPCIDFRLSSKEIQLKTSPPATTLHIL